MKSKIVSILIVGGLLVTAAAQTNVSSQTSTSANSQTSVSADKSGVKADSNSSASASNKTTASREGKQGSQKADASTSGSASNQTSGGLNIPQGTKIPAVLSKPVDSKKSKAGDRVEAKTVSDVVSNGQVIIPRNSKLIGHITEAKARGKGEAESSLGMVFDHALLKNGQSVPFQSNIQAVGAAVANTSLTSAPDMGFEGMGSGSALGSVSGSSGGGGGLLGGGGGGGLLGGATGAVGSTVGGVANTAGSVAGGATGTVGSTLGASTQTVAGVAGNSISGSGLLNSQSNGIVGLKGLQLDSANQGNVVGSVITSTGKSVKLNSGSQMLLNVTGMIDHQ